MTCSPHRSKSDKGAASGEKKEDPQTEEMAKFKDLAKQLLGVSKEALQRELGKKKT
jgi:hypothetical protein